MAYSTSNPPRCVTPSVGANEANLWVYLSADAATVVRAAGYITNGYDLGMKVGDIVFHSSSDASVGHIYLVNSVTVDGAADLSDGTAITATDTD